MSVLAVATGAVWAWKKLEVTPEGSAAIVERYGRYARTLYPGLNLVSPFREVVRNRIDLREQTVPFPVRVVSVVDGAEVPIEMVVQYSVTDPVKATYGVVSYVQAIERHVQYELACALMKHTEEHVRTSLVAVADSVKDAMQGRATRWGITLHELLVVVGETNVSQVEDGAAVSAPHQTTASHVYASNVTMNVVPHGRIERQSTGRESFVSDWRIERQEISGGNVQQGDGNRQDNRSLDASSIEEANRLICQILEDFRTRPHSGGTPMAEGEILQQEIELASQEGRAADATRLRRTWQRMATAASATGVAAAGTVTAELITRLGTVLGA